MKSICILIGRKIKANINRELALIKEFNNYNIDTTFLIPGKDLSFSYYDINDLSYFKKAKHIFINDKKKFMEVIENFDYFLIASWRDYKPLVDILKKNKKKIIVYSDAGGIDFWDLGSKNLLFKSLSNIYVFNKARRNILVNFLRQFKNRNPRITGSLRYQYIDKYIPKKIENTHIVIFPKSFSNVFSKLPSWFKNKTDEWYNKYIIDMKANYETISNLLRNAGFKISVRIHYSINDNLMTKDSGHEDYKFWKGIGVKIEEGDERDMFNNMDIGISVESHSAIDVNLHGKPYIFFQPSVLNRPFGKGWDLANLFGENYYGNWGFSDNYKFSDKLKSKLWLPYWYGCFANKNNLVDCIHHIYEKSENSTNNDILKKINSFYWGNNFQNPTKSIVNNIRNIWNL